MIVNTFYNPTTGMTKVLWLRSAAIVPAAGPQAVIEALSGAHVNVAEVKWLRERSTGHDEWEVATPLRPVMEGRPLSLPKETATYPVHMVTGHVLTDEDVSWILAIWQKQHRQ